jgi:hypothetical protein
MRNLRLVTLLLTGCTWISQGDIEQRRGALDDDQDGYIAGEDCDDSDPTVSPGAEEVWYDGIDSDCLRDDDYDADRDGFVSDQHLGLATAGVETSGDLLGGDCDDANRIIHPDAVDSWYDGIDSDCGGQDDYDQDADGFVPDEHVGLATTYVDGSGSLPANDCDDTATDIHPDAADSWYDGIDSDCGGQDDYDQDADGFVPDEYVGRETMYAPGAGGLPGGDCDDANAFAYTNAPDTAYDGLDWDCAGDDDYDDDGDGFVPDSYAGLTTEGVKDSGALPAGDCDDADAEINPGQIEVLSDLRDLDCDQDGDAAGGTSFSISALDGFSEWDTPFSPEFNENVLGVFLSMATYAVKQGSSNFYDSALAVSFDPTDPLGELTGSYVWFKHVVDPSSYELTLGHDLILTNEYLFGVTGLLFDSQRSFRLGGFDLLNGINGLSGQVYSTSLTTSPFSDMSLALSDDGDLYAVGCDNEDGVIQYLSTSLTSAADSDVDTVDTIENVPASACEVAITDSDTGWLYTSQGSTGLVVDEFNLSDTSLSLLRVSSDNTYTPDTISTRNDEWVLITDPDALYLVDPDGFTYAEAIGEGPIDADLSFGPDGALVISYVDQFGDAHVLYGDPAAGLESYDIDAGFAATEAAAWVEATNTHLMVAVLGTSQVAYGVAAL